MERVLAEFDVGQWRAGRPERRAPSHAGGAACRSRMPALPPHADWDMRKVFAYRTAYGLPEHPLEVEGCVSIGCEPLHSAS